MVQGLAFLSKKSWHTKNKANQEKVWIAEQKKEQESAKANELAREIQQEREAEELNRIAGTKSIKDRGIDWMYQEGTLTDLAKEDAKKEGEEYLLGKEFVAKGATQGDFDDGNKKEGIHSALGSTESEGIRRQEPGAQEMDSPAINLDPNSVQYRNENFRMRVEDPMFFVNQKEREKIVNRDKTEALYNRVVGRDVGDENSIYDSSSPHVDKKRSKKDKRHQRKKMKKSSRSRHDYDEHESRSYRRERRYHRRNRSSSRSRSRSRSYDRYEERSRNDKRGSVYHRHSRSSGRSRSRSYDRNGERSRNNKRGYDSGIDDRYSSRHRRYDDTDSRKKHRRHDTRKRKANEGREEYTSKIDNDRMGDHSRSRASTEKDADPTTNTQRSEVEIPGKIKGYGLKGGTIGDFTNRDIGPCKELMRKKKDDEQDRKNQNLKISKSRKRMTDKERKSALLQMKADARKRETRMEKQASHGIYDNGDDEIASSSKRGSSFLNDMRTRVNGITSEDHSSLSSRVAQNRHTSQRLHDSFL